MMPDCAVGQGHGSFAGLGIMRENQHVTAGTADPEELDPMSPKHFELVIAHMRLSESVANAVRRCMVNGEPQLEVEKDTGVKQSQISSSIRSVRKSSKNCSRRITCGTWSCSYRRKLQKDSSWWKTTSFSL